MGRRVATACRGLAALGVLLGVLIGPPLALIRLVGNPLPQSVPALDQVTDALTRRGVSDEAVIDFLAVLAWLIWIQIAIAVFVEIGAQIRSLPSPTVPVLPGLQPLAGQLVAAVVLLTALTGPRHAAGPTEGLNLAAAEPIVLIHEAPPHASSSDNEPARTPETIPTATYVVQRHDSLWSIAENLLGDGMRWREIRDLNIGSPQPHGDSLTATSDVIRPGWELRVPAAPESGDRSTSTHTVERGEHLWQIAEEELEEALQREASDSEIDPYWRSVIEDNRSTLADPSDPSLILTGQVLDMPRVPGVEVPVATEAVPDPAPPTTAAPQDTTPAMPGDEPVEMPPPVDAAPAPPPSPSTAAPTADDTPVEVEGDLPEVEAADSDGDEDEDGPMVPGLLGVAGTGLAAAVAFQLLRRRRDQQARAPIGAIVPPTPQGLTDTHREVVRRGDLDEAADVRTAMHQLVRHAAKGRSPGSRPRLVQVGVDHIDVLVDVPDAAAAEGWLSEASGQVWTRPRPVEPTADADSPVPLLVSIGRPEPGVELLYDLESGGLTVASGPAEAVDDLARSILLELVHGRAEVEVVAVGDVPVCEHDRVRTADSWEEVADDVVSWGALSADSLEGHKLGTTFAARGADQPVDGAIPLLVVVREIPSGARFEKALDLCSGGAALAVLALADEPADVGTNLIISEDGASIPSLGLDFEPQGIAGDSAAQIHSLVEAADQPPAVPDDPERDELEEPVPGSGMSSNGHPYADPDFDVLVRVLGQIEVTGGNRPLRPKQLAVLTFVATHPGCSAEQLEEALWPEPIETSRHRLHIALSQVRAALGTGHLPNFDETDGYRLADTVRTDLDLFERRVANAEGRPVGEAIDVLRGALDLVTGPPFTYRSRGRQSFVWIDTEHWMSKTEAAVVKAAWDMWQLCAEVGDCDGSIWAAHQGLRASPTNTELTNCLMKAHLARGDRTAAETVYRSHLRALDQLDLGDPEDSTVELWESEVRDRSLDRL